ncbi:hypothetical protein DdX_12697 [Ditylenchus destructor]|uniref:Uncharacterized protein n=1 Tax=Ditylenchus destructor TaxID=166010 RepID=A0AAD4QX33_9BILA|nr:hypothetical protein DdX_12697 [Ditylenchus destructor]
MGQEDVSSAAKLHWVWLNTKHGAGSSGSLLRTFPLPPYLSIILKGSLQSTVHFICHVARQKSEKRQLHLEDSHGRYGLWHPAVYQPPLIGLDSQMSGGDS